MIVNNLRLQNFRLYRDDTFEFDPSVNIIVGPNASGKTTLIEALFVEGRGVSYKAKDAELVAFGEPWARIDLLVDEHERTVKLLQEPACTKKQFVIDEKAYQRLTYRHAIPLVLFEPNQLSLLNTLPELRRGYLDDLIEQLQPGFSETRRHYKRVLAQRNALLKRPHTPDDQFFVWNIRLSELGGKIASERMRLIADLNNTISETYSELAGTTQTVELEYISPCTVAQYETNLLHQLESRLPTDRERGYTTRGPHRDDMTIALNGHPIQSSASRGETRTLMLTLKILEAKTLEQTRNQKPLMLLDDVFGELDGRRRHTLTTYLKNYQAFITTTDADVVMQHFSESSTIIPLGEH